MPIKTDLLIELLDVIISLNYSYSAYILEKNLNFIELQI